MEQETITRILFALPFYAVVLYGGYHRHKAHQQNDRFARMKNEGPVTFLLLRIFGGILWVNCLLFPLAPGLFASVRMELPSAATWTGYALALLSLPMGYSVFRSLGRNITDTVQTRAEHELVTHGIYRFIRHPLYTTGFLLFFGLGLFAGLLPVLLLSLFVLGTLYIRTFTEERFLVAQFGDRYREYSERTGKFLPKLNHL
ncbi:MAG: isoprenylcysteine carboxylmethyltransferase family protein [Bacteroidetes bacterium]|nr:isoprenylcysteine carboxylmethyltransferase family protein [Bacteroidota bacterium]